MLWIVEPRQFTIHFLPQKGLLDRVYENDTIKPDRVFPGQGLENVFDLRN